MEAFLAEHPEFEPAGPGAQFPAGGSSLLDAAGALRTLPWRDEIDGFYAARLRRRQ
jgi:16S rRNA C967 or C1407 C5-methylase (RsmB/RsmF family)